ncbi:MAG: TonB-dependent receptor plug domain-containing protein [Saprospiraceae bacterium]|nr:TonB-dependent receptor plug domain-containing protein [Saprospiraceae bacterium]
MKHLLLFFLLCLAWISWHQYASIGIDDVVKQVNQYHQNYPQEKIYIHTDKAYYVVGETIWFKVYGALATTHVPLTPSGLVYVSLLDSTGAVLTTRYIKIDHGTGKGDILIDPNWQRSGKLTLRAHTNYNLNFDRNFVFQKKISVYDSYRTVVAAQTSVDSTLTTDISYGRTNLKFYPEGGDLIEGLGSIVGVKATDSKGKGIAIKARVFDQSNNLVTLFITNDQGLGSFKLVPGQDFNYNVEANYLNRTDHFEIPAAKKQGVTLAIKPYKADTLLVLTQASTPDFLAGAHLLGHIRGEVFSKISLDDIGSNAFIISTSDLPTGIAHFTLFDREGMPLAERLSFIAAKLPKQKININLNQATYRRKQNGAITFKINSNREDSLLAFTSVSIYDQLLNNRPTTDIDIYSYFLLTSDLPGVIEKPGHYFENGQVINEKDLDLLMLTHGWRRFNWDEILSNRVLDLEYVPENGFTMSGQTTRISNDRGTKSNVWLSTLNQNFTMIKTVSDGDGYFRFGDLQFIDTTTVILQSDRYSEKDKGKTEGPGKDYLNINLDPDYPFYSEDQTYIPATFVSAQDLNHFLTESRYNNQVSDSYENLWSIDLEEITVSSKKSESFVEYHRNTMLYDEPDNRVLIDSIPGAHGKLGIFDVIRGRIPGVDVVGIYPNQTVRMRGYSSIARETTATILLDGVPISMVTANAISPERIAFVDVLKGLSKSAIYGSGGNGVIALYSKSPEEMKGKYDLKSGVLQFNHPGYYHAREFYIPDYHENTEEAETDYRTTLLWYPDIVFTKDEKEIEVPFSTSDRTSVYQLLLQGITTDGQPVSQVLNFTVSE